MATSGSRDFELDVADIIEEAYERCGIEVRTGYDAKTARRSMNLMFADWANRGLNLWTVKQGTITLTKGTSQQTLTADVVDLLEVVLRRDGTDFEVEKISRGEYLTLPSKTTEGRPSQVYFDRQITPVMNIWPTPENSTDVLVFNKLVRMDDADTSVDTMDLPFRCYPCFVAGLSYYLSLKKAPEKTQLLKQLYEEDFLRAESQDEDRASFKIRPYLRGV